MRFLDQLRVIKRLHHLISIKGTGNSYELSEKLDISRATMFRYMEVLTSLGADIQYCPKRKSYYFQKKIELNLERLVF